MAKVKVPVPNPVYGEVYYEANFLQIAFCPDCEYGAWTVSLDIKLGDEVRLITGDDPRLFTLILPAGIKEVRPQSFAKGQNVILILENGEEVELEFVADESLWEKERAFIESHLEEDDDVEALDMANDVIPPEEDYPTPYDYPSF